jgi:hypothetical protein
MTNRIRLLCIALVAVLSGCSTTPETPPLIEIDGAYVGAVERAAERTGADVLWVNPPSRQRDTSEDDAGP